MKQSTLILLAVAGIAVYFLLVKKEEPRDQFGLQLGGFGVSYAA